MSDDYTLVEGVPTEVGNYDLKALDQQAIRGNKAYSELCSKAHKTWKQWELVIVGLAALRDLACAHVQHRNLRSQDYRDTISSLMKKPKYAQYGSMRRQERSACYKLVDHINEISDWYDTKLSPSDRLKLNHPETIVKHVPKELLSIDPKDNTKVHKVAKKKKPAVSAETERLRAILIRVIKILAKYEPETARELMDEIMPKGTSDGPSDNIDDLFRPQDEEE